MNTELIQGATYRIRLTDGHWTDARFLKLQVWSASEYGFFRRKTTRFVFRNLETGREIVIKSRVRIKEALGMHTPSVPDGSTKHDK